MYAEPDLGVVSLPESTRRPIQRRQFVHAWFAETARMLPGQTAFHMGDRTVRYDELARLARTCASALVRAGATKGQPVAILTDDRLTIVAAVLGILDAGCAFVPIPAELPDRRIELMLEQAGVRCAIVGRREQERGVRLLGPVARAQLIVAEDIWADPPAAARPRSASDPDDFCYVFFTSGSTGTPKGIAGRLKGIDHFIRWEIETLGLGPGVRVSQLISPAFDAFLRDMFVPLCAGGTICVPPDREHLLDGARLAAWIAHERVNVIHCVPSLFRMLTQASGGADFGALTHVLLAGEPLLPADLAAWYAAHGTRTQIVNLYGPSETTMTKFAYVATPADQHRRTVPIGKPIEGCAALLLDEQRAPCPDGAVGEIYIRTPYRTRGYYRRPDLTAEVFLPNPFTGDPHDLIYRTGDLGRVREDGNFEFLGRRDHQVKIRGVRIELAEIENVLRTSAGVRDAAVLDVDDGAGGRGLCAYVVLRDAAALPQVRAHVLRELPEWMAPQTYVVLARLPLTATGKIDRQALARIDRAAAARPAFVPPRTPVEEIVGRLWAQVLHLERVGRDDHFFELRGHSLLATQVISRVRKAFHVDVPLRTLFEAPTLRGFCRRIEQALGRGASVDLPPLQRVSRDEPLPLSFAQQRLWFLEQLTPGRPTYNIASALRIHGSIALGALRGAGSEIARPHEVLRLRNAARDGVPLQRATAAAAVPVPELDLRALPPSQRLRAARHLGRVEARRPFDLEHGPLLRVSLVRLDSADVVLLATVHHIVSDGWSVGLFTRELTALYEAYQHGQPSPLPELPVQYADYAVWQRACLDDGGLAPHIEFWRRALADVPVLDLPTDFVRGVSVSDRGAHVPIVVPPALAARLRDVALREGVTPFMTFLAAFQMLLGRYSGQRDVPVGTTVANRLHTETEPLIGFFANQLVLRTRVDEELTFRALLARVRDVTLGAYAHQEVPFERLVEELAPARDTGRTPLFQVALLLQNTPDAEPRGDGMRVSNFGVPSTTSKFDLSVILGEWSGGFAGAAEYAADLWSAATVRRMMAQFLSLLEQALARPDQALRTHALLTPGEREQVLVAWNETARRWDTPSLLHVLVEEQVARTPDAIAVVFGDQRLSFAALNAHANQLAMSLLGHGAEVDRPVAVYVSRSLALPVALLAVLKARGAYQMIDPEYPSARCAAMIADARAALVLTSVDLQASVAAIAPGARALIVDEQPNRLQPIADPSLPMDPGSLAYVIYTSGSTGSPKGVMITHDAICNHMAWINSAFAIGASDRVLQKTPLGFDAAVWEFWAPLIGGGQLVLARSGAHRDPEYLRDVLRDEAITILQLVPSGLEMLLAEDAFERRSTLRLLFSGGETLTATLQARALARCSAELVNLYGPTEATIDATCWRAGPAERRDAPIGRPVANLQAYVLDREMQPLPPGIIGELYLGGIGLARGYLNRPAATAERFVPNPVAPAAGGRLYRTGDRARWRDDGAIEFCGRVDHQIKLRGHRIELGEIETVLERHPGVRRAVVLVDGHGAEATLVAYVLAPATTDVDGERLRTWLQLRLPPFMIPAVFVRLDTWPLTSSGKIDRSALPAPPRRAGGIASRHEPRDSTELQLKLLWEELLGVTDVGIHDNFFALGGHSLSAVKLCARIAQIWRRRVPVRTVFDRPTIAELAASLRRQVALAPPSCVVPIQPHGSEPPLFIVHPLAGLVHLYLPLAQCLGPAQPVYGLQSVGLEEGQEPLLEIERMASCFIRDLKRVQASGPYRLAGWSMGAQVAYEMAQQLVEAGESVHTLALLDGQPTVTPLTPPPGGWASALPEWEARYLSWVARDHLGISPDEWRDLSYEARIEAYLDGARALDRVPADITAEQFARLIRVMAGNGIAAAAYQARPYRGRVLLFRVAADPGEDASYGWRDLARGGLEVFEFPIHHSEFVHRPHVTSVADALAVCLKRTTPTGAALNA